MKHTIHSGVVKAPPQAATCGVCNQKQMTSFADTDLRARVCDQCVKPLLVAESVMRSTSTKKPNGQ